MEIQYIYQLNRYCDADVLFKIGGAFFGQNFELYIGTDLDNLGTLCAYGPTSDTKPEYNISCFSGAMTGRTLSIRNRFSGVVRLCDVQVFGENPLFHCEIYWVFFSIVQCPSSTFTICRRNQFLIIIVVVIVVIIIFIISIIIIVSICSCVFKDLLEQICFFSKSALTII